MKYIVKTGWNEEFEFNDGGTALSWAEVALTHKIGENVEVEITITKEEENES